MKEIKCRDLLASEIECRVGTVKDGKGFSLLLYKTARADMQLLDETYGINNWQCRYYQVKNTMICAISIWDDEKKQWLEKCDGGDDDFNAEKVKGECSDAFKRAGFRVLPSTRKLYNSPFIWVNEDKDNNKFAKYEVSSIGYDETSVVKLVIKNTKTNQVVYSYGTSNKVPTTAQNQERTANSKKEEENTKQFAIDMKYIDDYYKLCNERQKGTLLDYIKKVSNYNSIAELFNDNIWTNRIAEALRKANNK